ncbi:lamin tail domain-containing protein [Lutimonas vermicola]|uniref:Lamin tail domain-containing protein n=1 Tax=Lutimonas vermicola TaxID=414288 RepID=A0ABU9L4L1_9FLAO
MLKYYLCLYLLLYLIQTFAQSALISKHGFEKSGDNWPIENLSTPLCTIEDDTWNYHASLGDIMPSEGDLFWGIQDLNGNCGSSGFEHIEFSTINIADFRKVILSFDVQVQGYDNGDDMKYQLWLDGVMQPEVFFIEGEDNFSTDAWTKIQIGISNSISTVKLRISVKQNGSDIAGLDNIQLSGEPLHYCADLMISEYLEGSSSRSHRNNYIEIYNPSDSMLDLDSYQLVKYTGSNLEYSATLRLSGMLEPWSVFVIEDDQETLNIPADLSTNSSVMNFNGDDKIALYKDEKIIDLIGVIGDSINFGKDLTLRRKSYVKSPNNEFDLSEWDSYGPEVTNDLGFHSSYCKEDLPEIELYGLGEPILDRSTASTKKNNTYFGAFPIAKDTIIYRYFTIKNSGNKGLDVNNIKISGTDALHFSTDYLAPVNIPPNDSLEFNVSYRPVQSIIHTAKVEIHNSDASENPFAFVIQAEGTAPVTHPLLISQYYEGAGNNKWIELTNISDQTIDENTYYLALFRNEDSFHPIGIKPSRKKLIPSIKAGASIKFCPTLNVTSPQYALDGNEIKTSVCSFTGDDILVISTSGEESCWADRIDIIGREGNWGSNLSMVRQYGCKAASPNTGFETLEWLVYPYPEVDTASDGVNKRIGIHALGPTTWREGSWTNGQPDQYRNAIIDSDYFTDLNGDLEACSLQILKTATLSVDPSDYVNIENDLTVEGVLEIKHEGSLIMKSDKGNIKNNGLIQVHKTAMDLKPFDYTYWSSPVENAYLETVFNESPKNSFYIFSASNFEDRDLDGLDDNNDSWVAVSGVMQVGRGYTSMAPNATPFKSTQEVVFSGDPNNGSIEVPLSLQAESMPQQHHWNFIGNPYPSAIDGELLLNHPSNRALTGGTLYFWTHHTSAVTDGSLGDQSYTADDYAIYTIGTGGVKASQNGKEPTQFISSCQGFFAEVLKEGHLIFNNSMRTRAGNDNFFKPVNSKKKKQENKIWLNISNDKGAFSQLLIGFVDGATFEFDQRYDGPRLGSKNYLSFYSVIKGYKLAIQGLPPFQGNEKILLGFESRIPENTSLQISLDPLTSWSPDTDIFLYDKLLKRSQNLKLAPYVFELKEVKNFSDRFELRFDEQRLDDLGHTPQESKIIWQLHDNNLSVSTNNKDLIRRLEIFDLNGRKLKDLNIQKRFIEISWSGFPKRSVYILRAKLQNSRTIISKILP